MTPRAGKGVFGVKEVLSIGPFHVYLFGITIVAGMLAGVLLALVEVRRQGIPEDPFTDVLLYAILGGLLGARLAYVIAYNPAFYLANPLDIFRVNAGGMSIHGGILGGVLGGVWRARKHGLPIWKVADTVAPALILGQAIGRIGCDVFGAPMLGSWFWGVKVNGVLLHPAQLYEFVLNYLLFAYLWSRRGSSRYQGQVFVHYVVGFSIIRAVVELFRINPTLFNLVSVSHVLSLAGIAAGLLLARYLKARHPLNNPAFKWTGALKSFGISAILIILSTVVYYSVQG